ncbi:MAG: hemerythrin domain-containing protein [Acidobacteriia bacterium]|nr:hemerythrin domain-containing protein [Terriglobia bacterium]
MLRDSSLIPLSQQHHNGLALCVMTDRELARDSSAESIARLARRAVDRYEVELINHFEMEEQILFPEFPGQLVNELILDHRRLESMIVALRNQPTATMLAEFTGLLRRHIRREENELFEAIQRELPRQTLDRLGVEMDRKAVRVCL